MHRLNRFAMNGSQLNNLGFLWRTHMSFLGATGTPVLDFWWRLLWVSNQERVLPYSHYRSECNVHSLRSTSGATHADLLVAGLLPVLSPHTVAEVRLPGFELVLSEYLWVRCSTNWAKPGRTLRTTCLVLLRFLLNVLADTYTCPTLGPLVPLSGDISTGCTALFALQRWI